MKRLILFISILGLFALASCNTKNPDNDSTNSNQTTETSKQNEPSESSENESSTNDDSSTTTPSESKDENNDSSTSTTDESKKDDDTYDDMKKCLKKVVGLRIFEDENGKMNKSLSDVNGNILAISQFTLYADVKHGNRPSFIEAMGFDIASKMYDDFVQMLRNEGINVQVGIFGADMKISLINDGPVTIIIDSESL